jgi:UDP-N-acetylmuramoyl-tripeptide--D-alanyl-D-alanine ligase
MLKQFIQKRLEGYVKKYFKKHPEVKLVVVTGSVGKTSTKRAVATVLSQRYRVRMENGNYNTELSAPMAILGIEYPEGKIKNPFIWLTVFAAARQRIKDATDVDVIVQELGADHAGEIAHFGKYLKPNIAVVTGVTPEHMETFGTIEAVAKEELMSGNFSELAIINRDDIDGRFADYLTNPNLATYGTSGAAEYRFEEQDFTVDDGYTGNVIAPELNEPMPAKIKVIGEHSLRPAMAGVAVGLKLGMLPADIQKGLAEIRAVPGRMNVLRGVEDSIIIDDSYNSSPAAASAALQALYSLQVPQRIAVLGSMNELGATSAEEHQKLGMLCDPSLLAWVVTVGDEAETHLAPAARARGCQVRSFKSAIDAGGFVHSVIEPGSAVLVKGSQGNVYTEEAVKILCLMSEDVELVRQSAHWQHIKDKFFSKFPEEK